jgi:integrase
VVKVELRGIAKVKAKGRVYWYAWRGGPRLEGDYGSPAFIASYHKAVEEYRAPDTSRFRSLVIQYKASGNYKKLEPSTKQNWGPWLDRISDYFGDLSIAQFDRPEKIRPRIRQWRNQWADKPRTADYGMQVLSRVLSHAVDPLGKIAGNPCEGVKRLYNADRSEIIWTDADIAEFKRAGGSRKITGSLRELPCSPELIYAIDLAAYTGLRLGDLIRVAWPHVENDAIVLRTGKSGYRKEAIIPIYDTLRAVLDRIPKRATTVLTSVRHRPWTASGLSTAVQRAKHAAGWQERDLHFHDLRGTAATKFYVAGLSVRVIAEIMGWEEEHIEKIIRRYVGRTAAIKATIDQLNRSKGEQILQNRLQNSQAKSG